MSRDEVPDLEPHCGSWVIVCRESGSPVLETFNRATAAAINTVKYEVLTALQWLARLNRKAKESSNV